jgi:hypothetical protein
MDNSKDLAEFERWDHRISNFDKYVAAAYEGFDRKGLDHDVFNRFYNMKLHADRLYHQMWRAFYSPTVDNHSSTIRINGLSVLQIEALRKFYVEQTGNKPGDL